MLVCYDNIWWEWLHYKLYLVSNDWGNIVYKEKQFYVIETTFVVVYVIEL